MRPLLIQVVLLAVLLVIFVVTWKRAHEQVISRVSALLWSGLWIAAGVAVVHPQTTSTLAQIFGVGRGTDFVFYGAVLLLFLLVFKIFVALDKFERKLTELVRREALRDLPERKE